MNQLVSKNTHEKTSSSKNLQNVSIRFLYIRKRGGLNKLFGNYSIKLLLAVEG